MDKYIKVEGHSGLVRDRHSGAIINVNGPEIAQARRRKKAWVEQQNELQQLRNDVQDMKKMLAQMLEERNGSNSS